MNEKAVSPVIGVILMVAIVVVLAAVIAAIVFGTADQMMAGRSIVPSRPDPSTFEIGINDGLNRTYIEYPGRHYPEYQAGYAVGYSASFNNCSCPCRGGP